MYAPIGSYVEAMMRGENDPPGDKSREAWASGVVRGLLKPSPPRFVRHGAFAWGMVIINLLLPVWLSDFMFGKTTGLAELKRKIDSEETKKAQ